MIWGLSWTIIWRVDLYTGTKKPLAFVQRLLSFEYSYLKQQIRPVTISYIQMKKIIQLVIAGFLVLPALAQSADEVPVNVKEAFATKYKDIAVATWDKSGTGQFVVKFIRNKKQVTATFDANGKFVESRMAVVQNDMPKTVQSRIETTFKGYQFVSAEMVESAQGNISYRTVLETDSATAMVTFDENGNIMSNTRIAKSSTGGNSSTN